MALIQQTLLLFLSSWGHFFFHPESLLSQVLGWLTFWFHLLKGNPSWRNIPSQELEQVMGFELVLLGFFLVLVSLDFCPCLLLLTSLLNSFFCFEGLSLSFIHFVSPGVTSLIFSTCVTSVSESMCCLVLLLLLSGLWSVFCCYCVFLFSPGPGFSWLFSCFVCSAVWILVWILHLNIIRTSGWYLLHPDLLLLGSLNITRSPVPIDDHHTNIQDRFPIVKTICFLAKILKTIWRENCL